MQKTISPKKALAVNLRRVRMQLGYSQDKVAEALKIKRPTYQSYEEGRAEPSADRLVLIAELFEIGNLASFISNPSYEYRNEDALPSVKSPSPLQTNYQRLQGKDKAIVDILLGLRKVE
jgi:transcriptional regulator with XRE-family HTH domain